MQALRPGSKLQIGGQVITSFQVAPSLLSADFSELGTEAEKVLLAGVSFLHFDVMDGSFVPNLTVGAPVLKSLKNKLSSSFQKEVTKAIYDVHLMIDKPERHIEDFIQAGADILTLHVESSTQLTACFEKIKAANVKAGITLRPKTKLETIEPYLGVVDLVLVMSVEPGFGGQKFLSDQVQKIETLNEWRKQGRGNFLIEVDGGINGETSTICRNSGADVVVAGSYIFKGEKTVENYKKNISSLML